MCSLDTTSHIFLYRTSMETRGTVTWHWWNQENNSRRRPMHLRTWHALFRLYFIKRRQSISKKWWAECSSVAVYGISLHRDWWWRWHSQCHWICDCAWAQSHNQVLSSPGRKNFPANTSRRLRGNGYWRWWKTFVGWILRPYHWNERANQWCVRDAKLLISTMEAGSEGSLERRALQSGRKPLRVAR